MREAVFHESFSLELTDLIIHSNESFSFYLNQLIIKLRHLRIPGVSTPVMQVKRTGARMKLLLQLSLKSTEQINLLVADAKTSPSSRNARLSAVDVTDIDIQTEMLI